MQVDKNIEVKNDRFLKKSSKKRGTGLIRNKKSNIRRVNNKVYSIDREIRENWKKLGRDENGNILN